LQIVHFSTTRLAGAPIRLVRALQAHTEHEVRLVDLERSDQYGHDLVFSERPGEVVELCERADVIHLHNYLDYGSTAFRPIDFAALRDRGKRFVRHFHSTPETVAARMRTTASDVLACPIPSLVINGYPERYYPRARVVRNVVPQDEPPYRPGEEWGPIVFTPSLPTSAWTQRWNTKGAPETVALLRRVARATGCRVEVVEGRPLADVLEAKRRALAVVDDLVTGSFHLSGLEGLAVARPVLCHLDGRTRFVLAELTGSSTSPFVDVRLEEAEDVLVHLVRTPEDARELGRESREWLERNWADRSLALEYAALYEQLLEDPRLVARQPRLAVDGANRLAAVVVPDLIWHARREAALRARPRRTKAVERAGAAYRAVLPMSFRRGLRRVMRRPL